MRRWQRLVASSLSFACPWLVACGGPSTDSAGADRRTATLSAVGLLADASADEPADPRFERALEPGAIELPRDHGPHPGFRTEWWYFTGNLDEADDGPGDRAARRFGFQLTFFRSRLTATPVERRSEWASDQAWMAHFAITDVDGGRFYARERFSRGALGLAGAERDPFRVWLEDWVALGVSDELLPLRLQAADGDLALDLELAGGKPPVFQGDRGLSAKGPEPGNASYYYAYTRMPARGSVWIDGREVRVEGLVWMDREWSTSALGPGLVGWDWFSLQLEDGTELMLYLLRRADGTAAPESSGSWIAANGEKTGLDEGAFSIDPLSTWTSSETGAVYPSGWRLRVPSLDLDLTVSPLLEDQELRLSVVYWEGAVEAIGRRAGREVSGRGYVELTGYGEEPRSDGDER